MVPVWQTLVYFYYFICAHMIYGLNNVLKSVDGVEHRCELFFEKPWNSFCEFLLKFFFKDNLGWFFSWKCRCREREKMKFLQAFEKIRFLRDLLVKINNFYGCLTNKCLKLEIKYFFYKNCFDFFLCKIWIQTTFETSLIK